MDMFTRSTSHSKMSTSFCDVNEKMEKMHAKIIALKDKLSQYDILKEKMEAFMQMKISREKQVKFLITSFINFFF